MTITDRIFILGGTGNVGTKLVHDLLEKNAAITLYARTPSKVEALFPNHYSLINIVQGDYNDLSSFKEGIQGHTRLFLLISDFSNFVQLKTNIAKIAYESGVQQIVDISSFTVNMGWRTTYIGAFHGEAEKAIYNLPNRGHFVALRPGRFMSNIVASSRPSADNKIFDCVDDDLSLGLISTNDIGAVAAVVLTEAIDKHVDSVYSLTGDVTNGVQRARIVSDLVGREIQYQQVKAGEKYAMIMASGHFSHTFAMDLSAGLNSFPDARVTPEISILLGREPETLKEFCTANKAAFK